jgi:hypothetical protein
VSARSGTGDQKIKSIFGFSLHGLILFGGMT